MMERDGIDRYRITLVPLQISVRRAHCPLPTHQLDLSTPLQSTATARLIIIQLGPRPPPEQFSRPFAEQSFESLSSASISILPDSASNQSLKRQMAVVCSCLRESRD